MIDREWCFVVGCWASIAQGLLALCPEESCKLLCNRLGICGCDYVSVSQVQQMGPQFMIIATDVGEDSSIINICECVGGLYVPLFASIVFIM